MDPDPPAQVPAAPRRGGAVRRTVRWFRRTGYVAAALVFGVFLYLNQVGIPDWAKRPLLGQLSERGIDLDFDRIRLRLGRGLVAENVRIRLTAKDRGEEFRADGLHLRVRWSDLLRLHPPELAGIRLLHGSVSLPLADPDLADDPDGVPPLLFEDVEAHLVFADAELWRLEEFEARTRGAAFRAGGILRNPAALRASRRDRPRGVAWETVRRRLQRVVMEVRAAEFASEPRFELQFDADLLHPEESRGELGVVAAGVRTRFGLLESAEFHVRLNEPRPIPGEIRLDLSLRSSGVATDLGTGASVDLDATVRHRMTNAMPSEWRLHWDAGGIATRWGGVARATLDASSSDRPRPSGAPFVDLQPYWTSFLRERWTNLTDLPAGDLSVRLELDGLDGKVGGREYRAEQFRFGLDGRHDLAGWYGGRIDVAVSNVITPWGRGGGGGLAVEILPRADPPVTTGTWGPWRWLAPFAAEVGLRLAAIRIPRPDPDADGAQVEIALDRAEVELGWKGPALEIRRLDAALASGALGAEGSVDIPSRRVRLDATSSVDILQLDALLTPAARRWIRQFGWERTDPPRIRAGLGVVLPAWDGGRPDWRGEVVPTLTLAGEVSGNRFSFRGVRGDAASGTFTYTNRFWYLPRMDVTAPEGDLTFSYRGDERTKDYRFTLESRMDPGLLRPLFPDPRAERAFDQASFAERPVVSGDIRGRWKSPELIGADLRIALTNATIRGELIEAATGRATYTNGIAVFTGVEIRAGGEATVPGATYDIAANLLSFTNAVSTLPVTRVTRVIGPSATRIMDDFAFRAAPRVRVDGVVPVRDVPGADIRFEAEVPDVSWWRLQGSNITATVELKGDLLSLRGLRGEVAGGTVASEVRLDLTEPRDPLVRFEALFTNASLRRVVNELFERTNALEGVLTGRLQVGDSRSRDTNSWNGTGEVSMRDGFLWGIPMFGIFSPLFNALSPGLGETRFHSGTMTFGFTNAAIRTGDLRLHSPAMRLDYRGEVGFDGRLDAYMESRLLRDTPVLGAILNFALTPVTKLLEYRVTGTLAKPVAEPRYIPRFLLGILQPIRTLRSLLPDDDSPAVVEPGPEPPGEPVP